MQNYHLIIIKYHQIRTLLLLLEYPQLVVLFHTAPNLVFCSRSSSFVFAFIAIYRQCLTVLWPLSGRQLIDNGIIQRQTMPNVLHRGLKAACITMQPHCIWKFGLFSSERLKITLILVYDMFCFYLCPITCFIGNFILYHFTLVCFCRIH